MSRHRDPDEDRSLDPIVWRIVADDYEGEFTIGIFSTQQKAEEYSDAVTAYRAARGWGPHDWSIEEYELDPEWESPENTS